MADEAAAVAASPEVRGAPGEPLRVTLVRNGAIALVAGAAVARGRFGVQGWLVASALLLVPALGGHYLDVWFLTALAPRLSSGRIERSGRAARVATRLLLWFAAGVVFGATLWVLARALSPALVPQRRPPWWLPGLAFVGIELAAHAGQHLRGRASFYDGRG